jgi:O-antigen/teichoic acid export membrane protein
LLKKNALYSIFINLLNLGYPLISFTYVARILDPEGIGIFNYCLSIVGYFLVLSNLGIPRIAPVEISKLRNEKYLLSETINGYFSLNIIISIFVTLIYIFLVLFFTDEFSVQQLLLIVFSVQILSNCVGLDWLMQGMMHYKQLVIRDLIVKVLSLILLFSFVNKKSDIIVYSILYISSAVISSIVNFTYLRKTYKIKFGYSYISNVNLRNLIIRIFPISILTTIYLYFDTTLAGIYLSMYDVGIYSFAIKIVRLFLLFFDSIFVVLTPVLAYKFSFKSDINAINDTFDTVFSNLLGLFFPLSFLLFSFSNSIIFFLGGENFSESVYALKLLIPMSFFYIYSSLLGSQILYNIGEYKLVRNILFIVFLISMTLGYLFINYLKVYGVILVVSFSFLLLTVFYYYYVKKAINGIVIFSYSTLFKYFVPAYISFLTLKFLQRFISYTDIFLALLLAAFFIFQYIMILYIIKEKYLITSLFKLSRKLLNV